MLRPSGDQNTDDAESTVREARGWRLICFRWSLDQILSCAGSFARLGFSQLNRSVLQQNFNVSRSRLLLRDKYRCELRQMRHPSKVRPTYVYLPKHMLISATPTDPKLLTPGPAQLPPPASGASHTLWTPRNFKRRVLGQDLD